MVSLVLRIKSLAQIRSLHNHIIKLVNLSSTDIAE